MGLFGGLETRVLIVEDDQDNAAMLRLNLERDPRVTVVAIATTLSQALGWIARLEKDDISIVTLDANLTPGDDSDSDGLRLLREIRNTGISVAVLGCATFAFPNEGELQVDLDFPKVGDDFPNITVQLAAHIHSRRAAIEH